MSSLTNNPASMSWAVNFREAAKADGWSIRPTYKHEDQCYAATLTRDGWTMMILSRTYEPNTHKFAYDADVAIWAPDGLCVKPPEAYDWAALQAGVRTCNYCRATDVDTQRVGFAGRCCAVCLPEQRKKLETPGWAN